MKRQLRRVAAPTKGTENSEPFHDVKLILHIVKSHCEHTEFHRRASRIPLCPLRELAKLSNRVAVSRDREDARTR
jgi:hypothetical protein